VVGPTIAENAREELGPWWLRGSYRGQPVWLGLLTSGSIEGIDFAVPLAGRPLYLSISDRRTTTIVGAPEVRTGDPRFDAEFIVAGWPAEVLTAALDEATRHWLLSAYAGRDPQIATRAGRVQIFRSLATFSGSLGVSEEQAMPPAEIAYWLDAIGRLAAGLVGAFDQAHATIARQHGPAAAQAWVQAQVAAFATRDRARALFRMWVLGGVALFSVLVLVVIALVATQC
jgi:hypothetical protein